MRQPFSYKMTLKLFHEKKSFGPGTAELLETIQTEDSLQKAVKNMNFSYSKAWKIIKLIEKNWNCTIINSSSGGKDGGKSELTKEGAELLQTYNEFTADASCLVQKLFNKYFLQKTAKIKPQTIPDKLTLVRGAGDLATGTIASLMRAGFPVIALETSAPSAIRRTVAFSEAVYAGETQVEGMPCKLAASLKEALDALENGIIPLMIDPACKILKTLRPWALIDAIIAKKNLGTQRSMADKTIALGPGFEAGRDVDIVIETARGHDLGRIITKGMALPNTGIPGLIAGLASERVIHAPAAGKLTSLAKISDYVEQDMIIAYIQTEHKKVPVHASITGILRGLIPSGYLVSKGLKIADIDPRTDEAKNCFTISDKARCIAGSVLEALLYLENQKNGKAKKTQDVADS